MNLSIPARFCMSKGAFPLWKHAFLIVILFYLHAFSSVGLSLLEECFLL